jgi:hypothetical protein
MNVLEELHQMADLQECGRAFIEIGQLREIADRIESEWMELPRDKDGEVIHVGDIMRDRDGNEIAVDKVCSGGFFVGTRNGCFLIADGFTHVNPDTWLQVKVDALKLDDMVNHGISISAQHVSIVERCKALAGVDDDE